MALILVFSMGAIGTALTALRLWKTVSVWRLHSRGDHSPRWHTEVTLFALLSHIELCAIATSANLPTLTGWWRRARRSVAAPTTTTKTAQRSRSGRFGAGSGSGSGNKSGKGSGTAIKAAKAEAGSACW